MVDRVESQGDERVHNDYFIGKGLDAINWKYGSPPSQQMVIDISGIPTKNVVSIRSTEIEYIYGNSYSEFIERLTSKVGLDIRFEGFKSSIDAKFTIKSDQNSHQIKFAKVSHKLTSSLQTIGGDRSVWMRYLDQNFKSALEDPATSPKDVLFAYGTHVVLKAYIGGMAEYYCREVKSSSMKESEFHIAAKAGFKFVGESVPGSTSLSSYEKALLEKVSGSERLEVYGGDLELQQNIGIGGQSAWNAWVGSVQSQPSFLGFPSGGLIAIWDLTNNTNRRNELIHAYKVMMAKTFKPEIFSFTGASEQHPEAEIRLPLNYKLLSGGAKVNWHGCGNLLTATFPQGDHTWVAYSKNHMIADEASITVFVIGIYDPLDIWDVEIFQSTSSQAVHPKASINIGSDFELVGGGARVDCSGEGNLLTAIYPSECTFHAASKDHINVSPATISVFAVGLKSKLSGVTLESYTEWRNSRRAQHPSTILATRGGYFMTGGGARANWESEGSLLTSSFPKIDNLWEVKSKDHINAEVATITAFNIGVKVKLIV